MKKYLQIILLLVGIKSISQTNTFPSSGNVGIGTTSPQYTLDVNGNIRVGNFSSNDADEWPNFIWCRDLNNSWDEGLIKHSSNRGVFGRTGFGIHMEQSREFGFWSSGWTPLFSVKGGSGDTYVKGNLGIGTTSPGYKLDVNGAIQSTVSSGSNLFLTKAVGASIAFQDGTYQNSMIESGSSANSSRLEFWTNTATNSGIVERMRIDNAGNVGIGTTSPSEKLSVNGNIRSKKLIVTQTGWSDYVFNDDYKLKLLIEVEQFIKTNKHLPDVPSSKQVEKEGIDVGDNQALLLKKVEELTLYMIQEQRQIEDMQKKNKKQQKDNEVLKQRIEKLENKK